MRIEDEDDGVYDELLRDEVMQESEDVEGGAASREEAIQQEIDEREYLKDND